MAGAGFRTVAAKGVAENKQPSTRHSIPVPSARQERVLASRRVPLGDDDIHCLTPHISSYSLEQSTQFNDAVS